MSSTADLKPIEKFHLPLHPQNQSALFELPAEILDIILGYVFLPEEDLTKAYDFDTCYRRPGYFAPHRTHTSFLQSCQLIYHDAWYRPWTSATHTFYLAWQGRRPERAASESEVAQACETIERLHPHVSAKRKTMRSVQVFAQLCSLEPGQALQRIFDIPFFQPREIIITIRHTDFWSWEIDEPIYIDTRFVRNCRLPDSTTTLRMQLESSERRKAQIDDVSRQIVEQWYFKRKDGSCLVPALDRPITHNRWQGSSTWEGERWIRDEDDSLPGVLQYYVADITFVPETRGMDRNNDIENHRSVNASVQADEALQSVSDHPVAQIRTSYVELLGITKETPASEVYRLLSEFQDARDAEERFDDEDNMSDD